MYQHPIQAEWPVIVWNESGYAPIFCNRGLIFLGLDFRVTGYLAWQHWVDLLKNVLSSTV